MRTSLSRFVCFAALLGVRAVQGQQGLRHLQGTRLASFGAGQCLS